MHEQHANIQVPPSAAATPLLAGLAPPALAASATMPRTIFSCAGDVIGRLVHD